MRHRQRFHSQRTPVARSKQLNKSHIVEQNLQKKGELIDKYQTQIQDLIQEMNVQDNQTQRQATQKAKTINVRSGRTRALSSMKKPQLIDLNQGNKDIQKLILGLQYALQNQRKKISDLQSKNKSLQSQISNLRNLLVGPDQSKSYQKTIIRQLQDKNKYLDNMIIQQKKNYQFIIDTKNQAIYNLQTMMKPLKTQIEKQKQTSKQGKDTITRKFLETALINQELRGQLMIKNVLIQRLKYGKKDQDSDSDDQDIKKIRKKQKISFYLQQLEISNKLILRKNMQIVNLSNKIFYNQQIINIMDQYLDKKDVKNIDLNLLQNTTVNKLRILLRQKAVFERQLLEQLSDHNKKIQIFQKQIQSRQNNSTTKMNEIITDNKRLASLVGNLQQNIANLQRNCQDQRRDNEILKAQIQLQKKKFVDQVQGLKQELGTISSVTKNQFDRMKIQNLKLAEQNRSLLFLVGQKERQIHKKGAAIKTFQQYRQKINTLDVGQVQKRKIQSVAQQAPQLGSKIMLINTFSTWLFEWNKIKNWNNKKTLLNLLLDKQQIRNDAINSMNYLINVLHQCLLQSKNIQIQQRAIILISYYLQYDILKNQNFYLTRCVPIIVRGFRSIAQGEQQSQHRLLNDSTLRVTNLLQKNQFKWTFQMTNQMLSVNGLKYLFYVIQNSKIDDQIQKCFNTLNLIARANQMISFMMSFNITQILLNRMNSNYPFVIFLLVLFKTLLQSDDYLRSQKSLLQFRKLFDLLKADDDQQLVQLCCDCIIILIENTIFIKSLNKIMCLSILAQCISNQNSYQILKKIGRIYIAITQQLQTESVGKFIKVQLQKILLIIKGKRYNQTRFNRSLRIVRQVVEIYNHQNQLDQKVLLIILELYSDYQTIDSPSRIKLNGIANLIFDRNKALLSRFANQQMIENFVQSYKISSNNQQIIFLLKILYFLSQEKKTTQLLRNGRQSFLNRLIQDSLASDYNVTIGALKNLLMVSKQKYIEKFFNKTMIQKIITKVLNQRSQQQHIGLTLSTLYFLAKNQALSGMMIQLSIVQKVSQVILQRHQKQPLIFKSFALLQICNTNHYKKRILNYFISSDSSLQILKTINFVLRKSKNKIDLGSRAVFIYDYLNNKNVIQSFAILVQRNQWMIQDLIRLRNQYINKLDSLVYKVELLLHEISKISKKINKIYQKYKVQGDVSQQSEN